MNAGVPIPLRGLTAGARLNREFRSLLGPPPARPALVAVEQVYQVRGASGDVDFRTLIDSLPLGVPHLDPGDLIARRLQSGCYVSCRGPFVAVGLPALPGGHAATNLMARRSVAERERLAAALSPGLRLEEAGTQLAVEVPAGLEVAAGAACVRSFAPALVRLMDGPGAGGVHVRVRPTRIEIQGDAVFGGRLERALDLAWGGVKAGLGGALAVRRGREPELPGPVQVRVTGEADGWFIDQESMGVDPRAGDDQRVAIAGHPAMSLGEYCDHARLVASGHAGHGSDADATYEWPADVLAPRSRPWGEMAPVLVDWHRVVWLMASPDRDRRSFVSVPSAWLSGFMTGLEGGQLDGVLTSFLAWAARPRRGPALVPGLALGRPGMFTDLPSRRSLVPAEPRVPDGLFPVPGPPVEQATAVFESWTEVAG